MKGNFDYIFEKVIGHEGGYVNDPHDPGGETKYGISKRSYPNENIGAMTLVRAKKIYKRDYWAPVAGDQLPSGLDYVAFDGAVNSGVSRGAKWVQRALDVTQDGRIGPVTIKAAFNADQVNTINRSCMYRLNFMRSLKTWPRYKNGWTRRVDEVRAGAIAMIDQKPVTAKPTLLETILTILRGILK